MRHRLAVGKRTAALLAALVLVALLALALRPEHGKAGTASTQPDPRAAKPEPASAVDLSPSQLGAIKIEAVGTYVFPVVRDTVGSIDFNGDSNVAVYPPYQGRIIAALAQIDDQIVKGQPLYTIDSPDLIQAESTLISAAGAFELTSKELKRAGNLRQTNGVSERELEQATADQQAAEAALRAARDAVRVFGKSEAEVDRIVASRKIDPALIVRSPLTGRVTARNAQPGMFVQPGNAPAPYGVANLSTKWMLANVIESDLPLYRVGLPVEVTVMAYPDRVFRGTISRIYPGVDPATHRATIRSEIADLKNELRPGMLASFVIRLQRSAAAIAIPANGVVRTGDGTMKAWVTTDRRHFSQRTIKTGLRSGGKVEILDGLQSGELVVSDGAVFLSNMLEAPPTD